VRYQPSDGKWFVLKCASGVRQARDLIGTDAYDKSKTALKRFLCGYFSSGACNSRLGKSISPVGATPKGGKILKVRWALPGGGKSGGLRLVVVAFCDERRAVVAQAFLRKNDPSDDEIRSVANAAG
jgi:hypothetical protein